MLNVLVCALNGQPAPLLPNDAIESLSESSRCNTSTSDALRTDSISSAFSQLRTLAGRPDEARQLAEADTRLQAPAR